MPTSSSIKTISVIVPQNPFAPTELQDRQHCLCALDVEQLMTWWPGTPHSPHRDPKKVRAIQRSLDWRRVSQIASYLLQREIRDTPAKLQKYFSQIYQPKAHQPGREWPPKVPSVVGFESSRYRTFSNVLIHVNGAKIKPITTEHGKKTDGSAHLEFDEQDKKLNFSVIDGQHRINGAFFAIKLLKEEKPDAQWDIPAEIFLDLDKADEAPRIQAQIFIDVNFYQKKVDRSLVADLFPTARGNQSSLGDTERSQDLGRRLMLDQGPLVGMIQIPGIKYGIQHVVTLATLNSAIEDVLPYLKTQDISSLDEQATFLAACLSAWLNASGRKQDVQESDKLDPENVVYQGRVLVSFLTLVPAILSVLRSEKISYNSNELEAFLDNWLKELMKRSGLFHNDKFVTKSEFKKRGFLGSGGLARFRDRLWAAAFSKSSIVGLSDEKIQSLAASHRQEIYKKIGLDEN